MANQTPSAEPTNAGLVRDETFANAVWDALKGDHNDLRKQAIILAAHRATQADNVLRSDDLAAFERIASIIERHNGRQSEKVEDARLIARERIATLTATPVDGIER